MTTTSLSPAHASSARTRLSRELAVVCGITVAVCGLPAQADASFGSILLGDAARQVLANAAGLSSFFDREARSELIGPMFEGLRLFLKAPHDTEKTVLTIEALRQK